MAKKSDSLVGSVWQDPFGYKYEIVAENDEQVQAKDLQAEDSEPFWADKTQLEGLEKVS